MLKECVAPYSIFSDILRDSPDPKKIEDVNIQTGLRTLGNL